MPGAKEPKELEKLLGLHELSPIYAVCNNSNISNSNCSSNSNNNSGSGSSDTNSNSKNNVTNVNNSQNSGGNTSTTLSPPLQQQQSSQNQQAFKGWFIQPACAITGEGLQEGLEALHDMIIRKKKINKANKKKR